MLVLLQNHNLYRVGHLYSAKSIIVCGVWEYLTCFIRLLNITLSICVAMDSAIGSTLQISTPEVIHILGTMFVRCSGSF